MKTKFIASLAIEAIVWASTGLFALASFSARACDWVNFQDVKSDPRVEWDNRVFELCDLLNQQRSANGAGPVVLDGRIMRASQDFADDLYVRNYFSHTSLEGENFWDRLNRNGVGYGAAGENIAWGPTSANDVLWTWMNSPGHRENLLNPAYRRMGVGLRDTKWVQDFTD